MTHDYTVYMRAFVRAAQLAGSTGALAQALGLPAPRVARWMSGRDPVPADVFLKVVDFLIERDLSEMARRNSQIPPE